MSEDEDHERGGRDPDAMGNTLTQLLRRLVVSEERRTAAGPPRPKAINCRSFKIGENFPNFVTHFKQCIKAAYGHSLPRDTVEFYEACMVWLPTKLEPGPTLMAYESLPDAKKRTWTAIETALTDLFADETEKETFLADQGSFKRGSKSLIEYKNELMRLMNTYQPTLATVPDEFERQATTRFIEGLADEEVKKELRKYCKRDKMTVEHAYHYTVDHESSELQTRIRSGEMALLGRPAFSAIEEGATPKVMNRQANSTRVDSNVQELKDEIKGLASKAKIAEMRLQELSAKNAHTEDRLDIMAKEMGQTAVNVTKVQRSVDNIEQLLRNMQTNGAQQAQTNAAFQPRGNFHRNTQNRPGFRFQGRGNGGMRHIQPSLTGGVGYVNNSVQPNHLRAPTPNGNNLIGSATVSAPQAATPNAATHSTNENPMAATMPSTCPEAQLEEQGAIGGSWWSPGMFASELAGYDENFNQTLSFGAEDFYRQ